MVRNPSDKFNPAGRSSNNPNASTSPGRRYGRPVLVGDLFRGLLGDYTFLADEDISIKEVIVLRNRGYGVRSVLEELPEADDADVLALAARERLVLLGCDKGYGKLLFRDGHPPPLGGILFRKQPPNIADLTMETLQSGLAIEGNYIVVEHKHKRIRHRYRPLPPRSDGKSKMILLERARQRIITLESPKPTGSSSQI
jgi:predicted nuclease of predicted toxin-antitoxin system